MHSYYSSSLAVFFKERYVHIYCVWSSFTVANHIASTGVPRIVPHVTFYINVFNDDGNNVSLTLSWGEPLNNPIVNYTVSCSGNVTCPPNFTTDNTTRSYTITNLTPMTNYTFSVVATNSIGSGEAGVVMITTPPGKSTIVKWETLMALNFGES